MSRWYTATALDAEFWFDGGDTREEAIAKGRARYGAETFWIGLGAPVANNLDIFDQAVTPVTLAFDDANEANYGEDGEGGPTHWGPEDCADLSRRLNVVFAAWAQEHGYERGWVLDFSEQHEIRPRLTLAHSGEC